MKRFKVYLLDDAVKEFEKAFNYYHTINPTLSKKFYSATNRAINDLKINPFYQIRYDEFRMKMVKKFPFIIHFIINEDTHIVSIYVIRNSYQNPEKYPTKK